MIGKTKKMVISIGLCSILLVLTVFVLHSVYQPDVAQATTIAGMWEVFDDGTVKCMGDGSDCSILGNGFSPYY